MYSWFTCSLLYYLFDKVQLFSVSPGPLNRSDDTWILGSADTSKQSINQLIIVHDTLKQ